MAVWCPLESRFVWDNRVKPIGDQTHDPRGVRGIMAALHPPCQPVRVMPDAIAARQGVRLAGFAVLAQRLAPLGVFA
jgi:hypothetical protein